MKCAQTGKESFDSPQNAAQAAREMRQRRRGADTLQHYRCVYCEAFHVGNRPTSRKDMHQFGGVHGKRARMKVRFR